MNKLPQRAFVGAVRKHRVEPGVSLAAERATAGFVQGRPVEKRHPAGDTEILGCKGSGFFQANGADRNAREFAEGFAANAAIVRKDKCEERLEQAAEDPPGGANRTVREIGPGATAGEQSTREDPPPPDNSSVQLVGYLHK